jgi:hypothetical protein
MRFLSISTSGSCLQIFPSQLKRQASGLRHTEGSDAIHEKALRHGPGKIDKHFGLGFQHKSPVLGTLSGDVSAFLESLFDVAPGINRKKPSYGFLISQFQGSFDDILFVFLRIEAGYVGIPEQFLRDILFLSHQRYYITV